MKEKGHWKSWKKVIGGHGRRSWRKVIGRKVIGGKVMKEKGHWRSWRKVMEGHGRSWKVIGGHGGHGGRSLEVIEVIARPPVH